MFVAAGRRKPYSIPVVRDQKKKKVKSWGSSNYLTNDVKERAKTATAYKLNDSDLIEVGFMSYQQWAEAKKQKREAVMKKKKKVQLHQLAASPVFRWRKKWQITATELSITYELQPIRVGYHSEDNGGSQHFLSTVPAFWSITEDESWLSFDMGKYEVEGVSDCLWGTTSVWKAQCKKMFLMGNRPIFVTIRSCQQQFNSRMHTRHYCIHLGPKLTITMINSQVSSDWLLVLSIIL